jgi:hypothetical protein
MNTNELIDDLARDLAPVKRLPRPEKRAAGWLFCSTLYLALLAFTMSSFGTAADSLDPELLGTQLVGVLAGILAAIAAFASVVPGYSRRVLIWPSIATIAWLVLFVFSALSANEGQNVLAASHEWVCVALMLIGGGPLVFALAVMLRRGAPLNPVLTALLGALAVGLLSNFGACIARPHAQDVVTLAWHGGALVAMAFVCIAGSRLVLTWGARKGAASN